MIEEKYTLEFDDSVRIFEFESTGPKGTVKKIVQYSEANVKNYYYLGFGDKDNNEATINDLVVTNNGDSQKVLATVASTIYTFTEHHPDAHIVATGSTLARTRLYRIGISNNLQAIENDFYVFGLKDGIWEKFTKGIVYEAFLVKKKD